MAMTDPLGDMLTRIRNGQQAKKDSVLSPASKLRAHALEVLQREGYIRGFSEDTTGVHPQLRIELKYFEGQPAIKHVARVSKPGSPRLLGFQGTSGDSQRPWHHHRLDAQGRAFGCRSARCERRRRSARGGVLMSRIGKRPVTIPSGVTANIADGVLTVKGPKGTLTLTLRDEISYTVDGDTILVKPANDTKGRSRVLGHAAHARRQPGDRRHAGLHQGLEITGVGYRANAQGKNLKLQLGYSHDVDFPVPEGIEIKTPDNTTVKSRASTSRRSARSPQRSVAGASPSLTRARASSTAASLSSARKGRRSNGKAVSLRTPPPSRSALRSRRARVAVLVCRSTVRAVISTTQIIDDAAGRTLAAASTLVKGDKSIGANVDAAAKVGAEIAEKAKAAGITTVVFDRGGFLFHGRVKALADAAREGGLEF